MMFRYGSLERFLEDQGYWFSRRCTIVLTDADKEALNELHVADPIIWVLGYSIHRNEMLWIVPLPDRGVVSTAAFTGKDYEGASRYKLFTDQQYRELLSLRLSEQMVQAEFVLPGVAIRYGLWSNIDPSSLDELQQRFQENKWLLLDAQAEKGWRL